MQSALICCKQEVTRWQWVGINLCRWSWGCRRGSGRRYRAGWTDSSAGPPGSTGGTVPSSDRTAGWWGNTGRTARAYRPSEEEEEGEERMTLIDAGSWSTWGLVKVVWLCSVFLFGIQHFRYFPEAKVNVLFCLNNSSNLKIFYSLLQGKAPNPHMIGWN